MDTGITIDDALCGIVMHTCGAEVVQCRFHAVAPIIIRYGNASKARLLHRQRKQRMRLADAAQLEVAKTPANSRQRTPERILVVTEFNSICWVG